MDRLYSRRKHDSIVLTPQAPRIQRIPLPDVGGGDMLMNSRPAMENVPPPPKPRHHHRPSVDEGYSTSPEASTSSRRPSNASRTPQAQPMKGILKHGTCTKSLSSGWCSLEAIVETPIVHIARIQTDGYTSSPEKIVTSRYDSSRGQRSRLPSQPPPASPRMSTSVSLRRNLEHSP